MNWIVTPQDNSNGDQQNIEICGWSLGGIIIGLIIWCNSEEALCPDLKFNTCD